MSSPSVRRLNISDSTSGDLTLGLPTGLAVLTNSCLNAFAPAAVIADLLFFTLAIQLSSPAGFVLIFIQRSWPVTISGGLKGRNLCAVSLLEANLVSSVWIVHILDEHPNRHLFLGPSIELRIK